MFFELGLSSNSYNQTLLHHLILFEHFVPYTRRNKMSRDAYLLSINLKDCMNLLC